MSPETLGTAIRERRIDRGMGQKGLARLLGISTQSVSQTEQGNRWINTSTLVEYARALGCRASDLVLRAESIEGALGFFEKQEDTQ